MDITIEKRFNLNEYSAGERARENRLLEGAQPPLLNSRWGGTQMRPPASTQSLQQLGGDDVDGTLRVDHDVLAFPGIIGSIQHVFPAGQPKALQVSRATLYASTMFLPVAADRLDFDRVNASTFGHRKPGISGQLDGVDGVRHHCGSQAKILFGHLISHQIPGRTYIGPQLTRKSERVLDGIYPQMQRGELGDQQPG